MPSSDVDMYRFSKEKQPCYSLDCKIANGENILLRDLKICGIHWRSYVSFFILQFICLCVCHCSESLSTILTNELILRKEKKKRIHRERGNSKNCMKLRANMRENFFFRFLSLRIKCLCVCVCVYIVFFVNGIYWQWYFYTRIIRKLKINCLHLQ